MKAFISSIIVLSVIVGGIVWYEITLSHKADEINLIVSSLTENIYDENLDGCKEDIAKLEKQWDKMQNWLMAFNDHKEISEISRSLIMVESFSEFGDFKEMESHVKTFDLLLNYAVESSTPSLVNIL